MVKMLSSQAIDAEQVEEAGRQRSIVFILTENTPPSQWPLSIDTPLHTGDDGLVQTIKVKTTTSQFD